MSALGEADIAICSFLGYDNPELQKKRLSFHLKQREILSKQFPELTIVSVCSAYPAWAQTEILEKELPNCFPFFEAKRKYKLQIHNRIIRSRTVHTPVLILGDDVVPVEMPDLEIDPITEIKNFIRYSACMPAPCLFFSCKGTLRDTFYRSRGETIFSPTPAVTDWAVLLAKEAQHICLDKEIVSPSKFQYNSDAILRYKLASLGVECLKHQNLFFQTFQSTSSDKNSVWYSSREARKKGVIDTYEAVLRLWPWLFLPGSTPQKLKPVWMAKGTIRKNLLLSGCLRKTLNGYVPTNKMRKWWEDDQMMKKRFSLASLLPPKGEKNG